MTTRYYYSEEEIKAASSVSVFDYLMSGRGAYIAEPTNKIDRKTGEPIYTVRYDGILHDTVSLTSRGFKHWASGKKGCYYATEFLKEYCGFPAASKADKMKIIEEIYLAVIGTPEKTWEEYSKSKMELSKEAEVKLSNTPYFSATDVAIMSLEESLNIKPAAVTKEKWINMSAAERYAEIQNTADENIKIVIRARYGKELPRKKIVLERDKQFVPPVKNSEVKHVVAYLTKTRGLSQECISFLLDHEYIYESKITTYRDKSTGEEKPLDRPIYNLVVPGLDEAGKMKYAYKRETWDIWDGYKAHKVGRKPFKGEAMNSDKTYSWHHENPEDPSIMIFEAPIDAFSCIDYLLMTGMKPEDLPNIIALGGVATVALEHFLDRRRDIDVAYICFDNDYDVVESKGIEKAAGPKNANLLKAFLQDRGISAEIQLAPAVPKVDINGHVIRKDNKIVLTKDYNEFLRSYKSPEVNRTQKKSLER